MRNKKLLLPLLALVVAAGAVAVGFFAAQLVPEPVTVQASETSAQTGQADESGFDGTVYLDGREYVQRHDLTTVLFLGIDQSEPVTVSEVTGEMGRSDVMLVLVLDDTNKTMQVLQISRDTMVNVDVYDENDVLAISMFMQITMQYSFGGSAKRSCWQTKNKVSELLYGVPIDRTVSFVMDGIAPVTDALGGVKITFRQGDTEVDPAFTEGASAVLNGAQAEQFIRYRDTAVTDSNSTRMSRQMRFVQALYRQLAQGDVTSAIATFQDAAQPYLTADLDADTLDKLAHYTLNADMLTVPGATKEGEYHDEYYVDEDALRRLVVQLFYIPAG